MRINVISKIAERARARRGVANRGGVFIAHC